MTLRNIAALNSGVVFVAAFADASNDDDLDENEEKVRISQCAFMHNCAESPFGGYTQIDGGALCLAVGAAMTITDSTFAANDAALRGGAI